MTQMTRGDEAFAAACRQLERIARIHFDGVAVCLELHAEEPDASTERMAAESLGYALSQPAYLLRPLICLATSLELDNAAAKVEN